MRGNGPLRDHILMAFGADLRPYQDRLRKPSVPSLRNDLLAFCIGKGADKLLGRESLGLPLHPYGRRWVWAAGLRRDLTLNVCDGGDSREQTEHETLPQTLI